MMLPQPSPSNNCERTGKETNIYDNLNGLFQLSKAVHIKLILKQRLEEYRYIIAFIHAPGRQNMTAVSGYISICLPHEILETDQRACMITCK